MVPEIIARRALLGFSRLHYFASWAVTVRNHSPWSAWGPALAACSHVNPVTGGGNGTARVKIFHVLTAVSQMLTPTGTIMHVMASHAPLTRLTRGAAVTRFCGFTAARSM